MLLSSTESTISQGAACASWEFHQLAGHMPNSLYECILSSRAVLNNFSEMQET